MRRLVVVALLAGASFGLAPAAHAIGCPPFFSEQPTGLYNPTTGKGIDLCQPDIRVAP